MGRGPCLNDRRAWPRPALLCAAKSHAGIPETAPFQPAARVPWTVMKRRARRVVIAWAVLGAVLLASLVVANWGMVRDHFEAWHFQLTTYTKTFEPEPVRLPAPEGDLFFGRALIRLQTLSTHAKRDVICDPGGDDFGSWMSPTASVDEMLGVLRENGYRILQQSFPRRAYVVIRATPTAGDSHMEQSGPTGGRRVRLRSAPRKAARRFSPRSLGPIARRRAGRGSWRPV